MKYPSLLFTADSGGTPTGGASPVPPAAAPTPPADAGAPAAAAAAERAFTQADVDRIIADRLARQKTALESAAAQQRTAAEQAALAEQGQYKTLAEQHAARLAELEPKAQQVERYEKALDAQLTQLKADLPEHILTLLESQDKAAQLEWLAANRAKLVAAPTASAPPAAVPAPNTNAAGGRAPVAPDAEALKKREEELKQRFRIG